MKKSFLMSLSTLILSGSLAQAASKLDTYRTCDLMDRVNRTDRIDIEAKKITVLNGKNVVFDGKIDKLAELNKSQLETVQAHLDSLGLKVKAISSVMIGFNINRLMLIHTAQNKDIAIDLNTFEIAGFGPTCEQK